MEEDINYEVIKKSYDFTIDINGQLCGLTAGDMGYEDTNIYVDDFCKKAITYYNEWININQNPPKDGTVVQLYGRKQIPNNWQVLYEEEPSVNIGFFDQSSWCDWYIFNTDEYNTLLFITDVTHFRYINRDKPNE